MTSGCLWRNNYFKNVKKSEIITLSPFPPLPLSPFTPLSLTHTHSDNFKCDGVCVEIINFEIPHSIIHFYLSYYYPVDKRIMLNNKVFLNNTVCWEGALISALKGPMKVKLEWGRREALVAAGEPSSVSISLGISWCSYRSTGSWPLCCNTSQSISPPSYAISSYVYPVHHACIFTSLLDDFFLLHKLDISMALNKWEGS